MRDIEQEGIESLVARYTEAAISHGAAMEPGDHIKANRAADAIAAVYRELRRRGGDAQRHLLPLLDHPDPSVRSWAGAHALEFAPGDGERALSQLCNSSGKVVAFNAKMTLAEWRKGRLRFP
jgi:hypothetical protein